MASHAILPSAELQHAARELAPLSGLFVALVLAFTLDRTGKRWAFGREATARTARRGRLVRLVRRERPAPERGVIAAWVLSGAAALVAGLMLASLEPVAGAWTRVGLGAALGGALGNAWDRVRHHADLDFLDGGPLGVFNPADAALVLGLALVVGSPLFAALAS